MSELGRGSSGNSDNFVGRSSCPLFGSSMFDFWKNVVGGHSRISKSADNKAAEAGSDADFMASEAQASRVDSSRSVEDGSQVGEVADPRTVSKIGAPTQVQVDIALYSVVTRSSAAREERLVLRRTVSGTGASKSGNQVEELWVSGAHQTVASALCGLRELSGVFEHVMLGKVVKEMPGMSSPDAEVLKNLQQMRVGNGSSVGCIERLFNYSGVVKEVDNQLLLVDADVRSAPGSITAREAWSLITGIIDRQRLQMTESRSTGDAERSLGARAAGIARSLDSDIAHARIRLEQEQRWRRIENTQLEPQPGHYLDGLKTPDYSSAVWSYWERRPTEIATDIDDLKKREIDEEIDSVVVTLIDVEGAQVGENNEQINLFSYRLDPQIDLYAVLRQPEVQMAFAEYAVAPGDEEKRQAAISSLQSAHARQQTDWQVRKQEDVIRHSESGSVSWLRGTVIFSDCRGIQVGNYLMQRNTFTYTLAPTVNANELLCAYPYLVEAIVDYSCGLDGLTARAIQHGMANAVSGIAETVLMRTQGAGQRAMVTATYHHEVGLSVGDHNSQQDTIDVTSTISKTIRRVLEEEKHKQDRKLEKTLEAKLEAPDDTMDYPSRGIDRPSRGIDRPSPRIDPPSRGIDRPSPRIDPPSRGMDYPSIGF